MQLFPNYKYNSRVVNSIDGKWGSMVDKETNAFNGMIGMVQRKVKQPKICLLITHFLYPEKAREKHTCMHFLLAGSTFCDGRYNKNGNQGDGCRLQLPILFNKSGLFYQEAIPFAQI